jgi:3-isopropylmalate/(R)-2-methylmalate dehydratase small subunit
VSQQLLFEGTCWKFDHNIPTDVITPISAMEGGIPNMRKHVMESANPDFASQVQPGDIMVAGRNFACSSGRAVAPKALQATQLGIILAESFSRTFYRNAFEIGLPIMEVAGIHAFCTTGDRLRVDYESATVTNLASGATLTGTLPSEFLMEMLRIGGLIPLLAAGSRFISTTGVTGS